MTFASVRAVQVHAVMLEQSRLADALVPIAFVHVFANIYTGARFQIAHLANAFVGAYRICAFCINTGVVETFIQVGAAESIPDVAGLTKTFVGTRFIDTRRLFITGSVVIWYGVVKLITFVNIKAGTILFFISSYARTIK